MINMIKADLYRIFKGKVIYISCMVIILMLGISCYTIEPGYISVGVQNTETNNSNESFCGIESEEAIKEYDNTTSISKTRKIIKKYGGYPLDTAIIGANANLYYVFIAIVFAVMVCDLSNSTAKNTLSSAIPRKKYYLSKLITSLLLCTLMVFFNNYVSYAVNLIVNGKKFSAGILEVTKCTFIQLPIMFGIISLLVCFGSIFRKTSIFNSISIPFIIVVQLIIAGISAMFRFKADNIIKYEYQTVLENLVNNPASSYIIKILMISVVYIVIFNVIGYRVLKKTEIK